MHKIQLLGLGLISLLISSCGNNSSSSNVFNDVECLAAVKDKNADKSELAFSCMDSKGKYKYEDLFKVDGEYIGVPSNFVNGYFTLIYTMASLYSGTIISNHYPLYKASKQPEIVKGCEDLYSVGCMNDGVIPISKQGERISVIDGTGKTLFTLDPIDGKEIVSCDIAFYDGLLRIKNEDNKYGFVDKKGNVVIKPQYYEVFPFSEGKALVEDLKGGWSTGKYFGKYSIIDTKGNVISSGEDCGPIDTYHLGYYRLARSWGDIKGGLGRYHDGMLLLKNNDRRFLFLDGKGNIKFTTPAEVTSVTEYNSKYFVCDLNNGWGVMDFNGNVIIPGQYRTVVILGNGNFLCGEAQYSNRFHLYDSSGKEKSKVEYESIDIYENFIIATFKTHQNNRTVYKDRLLDNDLKHIAEIDLAYASFVDEEVVSSYFEKK